MANDYGWSDFLENKLFSGETSTDELHEAIVAYVNITGDGALRTWATLDWASKQLAYVGDQAGPADYDQVLEVLPQGYLPADVDRRVRAFAARSGSPIDPELWRSATTALARMTAGLWGDVVGVFRPVLEQWRAEESARRAAAGTGGAGTGAAGPGAAAAPPAAAAADQRELPLTLDEAWLDPETGTAFRDWAMDNGYANPVNFCVWNENFYRPGPSWDLARTLYDNFLAPGAGEGFGVSDQVANDIQAALPHEDADPATLGDPPNDLFDWAWSEASQALQPAWQTYRATFATYGLTGT